jgi:uncharacterized protein (DUF2141 family)
MIHTMHDSRGLACVGLGLLGGVLALAPEAAAEPASPTVTIRVAIKGLRSDSGQVGCTIFASSEGFPSKPDKATQRRWVPITGKAAICEFGALPPGNYAIAAIHDENGNGKLDKTFFGKPTEGIGVSRDPRPGMRAPHFDEAVLPFRAGRSTLEIVIHY